ncbi:MAG: hypothetical protein KBG82_06965 [Spirochaetes bacterium]|nr:hypothetical protein [Spirochaetota bacterium]
MTKDEIKKEIEDMRDHYLDVKEVIELVSMKILKNRERLNIWDYRYLLERYSNLQIVVEKLELIEKILKLF